MRAANPFAPTRALLSSTDLAAGRAQLHAGWQLADGTPSALVRTWTLPDYAAVMTLANHLFTLSEQTAHHPELTLAWGRLTARIWTHDAGGVTAADLAWAWAADALASSENAAAPA